jgi:hypothetical protein
MFFKENCADLEPHYTTMKRICLWSGPRNVSTALMYSFAQRPDTRVIDEPLYGPYLVHSGVDHPGREELLEELDLEVDSCLDRFVSTVYDRPVLFVKNMAHHLEGIEDHGFLRELQNIFLIRDPEQMLPTLIKQIPYPTLLDTAYEQQHQLYTELVHEGHDPLVIDSRSLLLNPEAILEQVCERLGIPYTARMLQWPAGPRPEDGAWAPHWYHNLHTSTGFQPYKYKTEPFPEFLHALLRECLPHYNELYKHALKAPNHD